MEPINAVMYQGAGWHSRADPRDHYGGDHISAKLSMSHLQAAVIPLKVDQYVPKERICKSCTQCMCEETCFEYNNHDFNNQRLQRDYETCTLFYDCQNSVQLYVI